ncbi:MAG TPA: HD domain-containing phosphohydrolase [Acidobacteriota bacterium]|nr:HD domain-containing phosphohydrolase [Acidobacteriota bacterium]
MVGPEKSRIVVVDDEQYICNIIVELLSNGEDEIVSFCDPHRALEHIRSHPVDLVLTDLVMGRSSGVEVLETTLKYHDDAIVILITAHPTVQTAISVLKRGAYDFLVKPFKLELLRATVRRGLAHQKVVRDNLRLRGQVEFLKVANTAAPNGDIDEYLRMVLRSCITELSATAATILAVDPATGKVSRKIHETDDGADIQGLLDESTLEPFTLTKSVKPIINSERVTVDGEQVTRIFISKPIILGSRCHGVINLLVMTRFESVTPGQLDVLTILANSAASAITNAHLYQDLQTSYLQAIRALANAIEARDAYTAGHTDRVIKLAALVAHRLGWDESRISDLIMGCTLHDIGKIGVPDCILNKPSRLDDEERRRMIRHPSLGLRIIRGIRLFKPSIPYIIAHHERYDGNGYPKGLKGEEIPIEGRLLAVVDTFDAIMSDRPYRSGAPLDVAVRELIDNRGTQFDPELVNVFLNLIQSGGVNFQELYGREAGASSSESVPPTETARA